MMGRDFRMLFLVSQLLALSNGALATSFASSHSAFLNSALSAPHSASSAPRSVLSAPHSAFSAPHSASSAGAVPLPQLPPEFHAIVEWNDENNNKTVLLEEWYRERDKKGAVTDMDSGTQSIRIMDFETEEMYEIRDRLCVTVDMTNSNADPVFGRGGKMLSPSGVLGFGGKLNETYLGKDEARGIACDLWVYSGAIPEMNIKHVNILWYFVDEARWTAATGRTQAPVASKWYGVKVGIGGKEEKFDYTYEYVKWEPYAAGDPRVFQTPPGVFCPGRKNTKKLPKLPTQFALTIEEVNDADKLKRTTRLWYDQPRLLARYDHMPTRAFDDFDDIEDFEYRPLKEIHDFRTGLAYTIDALRGNCSIRALKDSIDVEPPFAGDDSTVPIMKNPMEIFHHEDSDFHYTGERIIRETEVDVWIGKPNIPVGPDDPTPPPEVRDLVYEWLILRRGWKAIEGVSVEGDVPMQMITYKDDFPIQVLNINDFDSERISILNFDIHSCFRAFPERKHFQFSIAGGDGTLVGQIDDNINAFKEALIESLGAALDVRPVRISNILVDDDDDFVYVLFSMTQAPLPGTGGIGEGGYPDIPLAEATTKLEAAIKGGSFVLKLLVDGVGDVFIKPETDSLVETLRPGGRTTTPAPPTATTKGATRKCAWYGQCGVSFWNPPAQVPCKYDGPPKPLLDTDAQETLEKMCGDVFKERYSINLSSSSYASGATGPELCCDASQVNELKAFLDIWAQQLRRCPSCHKNFLRYFCVMTCAPNQAEFMVATKTEPVFRSKKEKVVKMDVAVSTATGENLFRQCADVRFPSNESKAIPSLCGTRNVLDCNAEKMLNYMGSTRNGVSPFDITTHITDSPVEVDIKDEIGTVTGKGTVNPAGFDISAFHCDKSYGDAPACACQDCAKSCRFTAAPTAAPTTTTAAPTTPTTTTTTTTPTSTTEELRNGVFVPIPTLLVVIILAPICCAGLTVAIIFLVMRKLSALPQ